RHWASAGSMSTSWHRKPALSATRRATEPPLTLCDSWERAGTWRPRRNDARGASPRRLRAADGPAGPGAGTLRRGVAGPGDVTVGPHEHEARGVGSAPVAIAVAYDFQRHAQRSCRLLERRDGAVLLCVLRVECQQAETRAELLEHVAACGQKLRRQVMAGPGLETVRAVGRAHAIGRAEHHR